MRHDLDSRGLHATPHVVGARPVQLLRGAQLLAFGEMFYDANITWLGGFNGPPNFVLCVSCHNPHGTNVVSPRLDQNNKMTIYRQNAPAMLCNKCHS